MKLKIIGIFFYSIYLLALAKPIFPIIDYFLNYNYIATQLCENRDKPFLACNGKCYLEKELQEASNSSQNTNTTIPKVNTDSFPITIIKECAFSVKPTIKIKKLSFNFKNKFFKNSYYKSIFKPPKFTS